MTFSWEYNKKSFNLLVFILVLLLSQKLLEATYKSPGSEAQGPIFYQKSLVLSTMGSALWQIRLASHFLNTHFCYS